MDGMWSAREAAERLGVSEQHVRLLLKKGEVKGRKVGGTWVVLELDYKRKRRKSQGHARAETGPAAAPGNNRVEGDASCRLKQQ